MARPGQFAFILAALVAGACARDAAPSPEAKACAGTRDDDMVWIPAGSFTAGESPRYAEEGPPQSVSLHGFWIDRHEITNRQFTEFVDATGYLTIAEREQPPVGDAGRDVLPPGSAVFTPPTDGDPRWWRWAPGANWRLPEGPGAPPQEADNFPVTQIAIEDAVAYASWAGKSLPTEMQFEYAARAGGAALPEPVDSSGAATANYYQGVFPFNDIGADGYAGRAPVGCFKPNAFGLYDMIGNVWEWTRDEARENPNSYVIKGGSYLCAKNYCARYRPAARQFQERALGTNHIGFRLVDNDRPAPQ